MQKLIKYPCGSSVMINFHKFDLDFGSFNCSQNSSTIPAKLEFVNLSMFLQKMIEMSHMVQEERPHFTILTSALPWAMKNGIWQTQAISCQFQLVCTYKNISGSGVVIDKFHNFDLCFATVKKSAILAIQRYQCVCKI